MSSHDANTATGGTTRWWRRRRYLPEDLTSAVKLAAAHGSVADVIVDTSKLLAYFDTSEPDNAAVSEVIGATTDLLVVSPYVVAELDYLVVTRHGVEAELAVLDALTGGTWELAERYRTRTVLTLDRRHFDVLRSAAEEPFTVLPGPS